MIVFVYILSFLVGVLSSWTLWYLLSLYKPKIEISQTIAYLPERNKLKIKVINKGRRQATDIRVDAFVMRRTKSGKKTTVHWPEMASKSRFGLNPLKNLKDEWNLPTASTFTIRSADKVVDLLASTERGEHRLVFTLSATDAITSSKVIIRTTYSYDDIREGRFIPYIEDLQIAPSVSDSLLEEHRPHNPPLQADEGPERSQLAQTKSQS